MVIEFCDFNVLIILFGFGLANFYENERTQNFKI